MVRYRRSLVFVLGVLLLVVLSVELAQASDIFNSVVEGYKNASKGWFSVLLGYAKKLFWSLAIIEFAWAACNWALERHDLASLSAALFKKIMSISFFYALLLYADTWVPAIINSLKQAGQTAAGTSGLSPSDIIDTGIDVAGTMLSSIGGLGLFDSIITAIVGGISSIFIIISFLVVAAQLMVTLIESYIIISAGVLFLGFGGARWTTDFTQKYLNYAFATGVKLFMIYLVIGLGMDSARGWGVLINSAQINSYLVALSASLFFAYLAWSIPNMAASMLSGTPSLTAGGAGTAAGITAAGTIGAGATVVSPALQQAKGGIQAASAGYASAKSKGLSGSSALIGGLGTAAGAFGRETMSSIGASLGLNKPSSTVTGSTSATIGGRAADSLHHATAQRGLMGSSLQGGVVAGGGSQGSGVGGLATSFAGSTAGLGKEVLSGTQGFGGATAPKEQETSPLMSSPSTAKSGSSVGGSSFGNDFGVGSGPAKDVPVSENTIGPSSSSSKEGASKSSSLPATGILKNNDKKLSDLRYIKPPQLPPDGAGGGSVHIRLGHSE